MENNNDKLQEQQAPLKNHDNAFVQVGKDGEPVIPQKDEKKDDWLKAYRLLLPFSTAQDTLGILQFSQFKNCMIPADISLDTGYFRW